MQCARAAARANAILGQLSRVITFRDKNTLRLYNPSWSTQLCAGRPGPWGIRRFWRGSRGGLWEWSPTGGPDHTRPGLRRREWRLWTPATWGSPPAWLRSAHTPSPWPWGRCWVWIGCSLCLCCPYDQFDLRKRDLATFSKIFTRIYDVMLRKVSVWTACVISIKC